MRAACLKDLQAFFRDDDAEERPAFFAVGKYNFARSDLVPLVVTYPEDYDVVFNAREPPALSQHLPRACARTHRRRAHLSSHVPTPPGLLFPGCFCSQGVHLPDDAQP